MFHRKSFNLSAILNRSQQHSGRVSQVMELKNDQDQSKDFVIKHLKQQNHNILQQLQTSKEQLQSMKQLLINTRIEHDNQRRGYEQILQQLKTQLSQKDELLAKCAVSFRQSLKKNQPVRQIKQQSNEFDIEEQLIDQNQQNTDNNQNRQVHQLQPQGAFNVDKKQQQTSIQLQILRAKCEKLRNQVQLLKQKSYSNPILTNDRSFNGKPISRESFDFGDITTQLQEVEQIAEFTNDTLENQQQIEIREERIQNLQRENFQLQHQIATKSHKLATIFNAAFQYGGMQLLDCLQNAIGLVQSKLSHSNQ